MQERSPAGPTRARSQTSSCAGCGAGVALHLVRRAVEGPRGSRGAITYVDEDIIVWDCPGCGFANADEAGR